MRGYYSTLSETLNVYDAERASDRLLLISVQCY